ncbi:MAG: DNA polymerase III subunit delta [Lachnospiraceae bacterium]|nr:DNA polymerase III subunit delta [Candidatus Equihabitans merdae]
MAPRKQKQDSAAYKTIAQDIKAGDIKRVYVLFGPEAYLRQAYRQRLCRAVVSDDDTMNRNVFSVIDTRQGDIIEQAETMPFFAEKRLIYVRDSGLFKSGSDELADYMSNLPDYVVIVFDEDEVDKKSRLYKACDKNGRVVEFTALGEDDLRQYVAGTLGRGGKRITLANCNLLLERTGNDLGRINNELDKLVNYVDEREEVTKEDIELLVARELSDNVFDLVSAVSEHKKKLAISLYHDLLAKKEPPMKILSLIQRQFRQMLTISELYGDGLGRDAVAEQMHLSSFVVKKLSVISRSYKENALRAAVERCIALEEDVKNGRLSDRLAVELLLIQLSD